MTASEFIIELRQLLPDNTTGLITPAALRQVLELLVIVLAAGGFDPE